MARNARCWGVSSAACVAAVSASVATTRSFDKRLRMEVHPGPPAGPRLHQQLAMRHPGALALASCPRKRIGAKVTVACFGMSVVWVARADGAGVPVSTAAKTRGSVAERSLAAEWRRVGASAAKRRVESGGVGQAGRVLKLVDQRLKQKDHQQMCQHIRPGGALIDTWWSFQANQAFQALEAKLDAPSQAIEGENIGGRELLGAKRGHDNNPICRGERSLRDMVAFPLRVSARLAARGRGGLHRLLDGNQPQPKRRSAFARDPNRLVDQPACRRLTELGAKIDRITISIAPARTLPAGTHDDIGTGVEHGGDAIRLQIRAIADADLAFHHRNPVEPLALVLIRSE